MGGEVVGGVGEVVTSPPVIARRTKSDEAIPDTITEIASPLPFAIAQGRARNDGNYLGTEPKRLADLGAGIRGGKSAYWCSFGEAWEGKLLEALGRL